MTTIRIIVKKVGARRPVRSVTVIRKTRFGSVVSRRTM